VKRGNFDVVLLVMVVTIVGDIIIIIIIIIIQIYTVPKEQKTGSAVNLNFS
jgi:hypothetical protein